MSYTLEKLYDKYDYDALCDIWKGSLPNLNEKRIKWAYENNPSGKCVSCLIKDEKTNEFIGTCSIIPRHFIYKGDVYRGAAHADFAIKNKFRTLGPALKLIKFSIEPEKDIQFLLGFPNKFSSKIMQRAGFKKIGSVVTLIKVLKSRLYLEKKIGRLASNLIYGLIDYLLYLKAQSIRLKRLPVYEVTSQLTDEIDAFCKETKMPFNITGSRNSGFLHWRFQNNPYYEYKTFIVRDKKDRRIVGFAIFRIEDGIAHIDDYRVNTKAIKLELLFDTFTLYCLKKKYRSISIFQVSSENYASVFKKMGFLKIESDNDLLCKNYSDLEIDGDSILLTRGDCDF